MRLTSLFVLLCVLALPANAEHYWVAYEGDDFPENEGWERVFGDENGPQQGGSNRSLSDGILTLDSTRNHLIYDAYIWRQELNPEPGEMFVCEWRMRVISNLGPAADSLLGIARDGGGTLGFDLGYEAVRSSREGWSIPIVPGEFHTYRITSLDMVSYEFWLNGNYVRDGIWDIPSLNESYVGFGDSSLGGNITSLAEWDYVRFGVIPEPASGVAVFVGLNWFTTRHRR